MKTNLLTYQIDYMNPDGRVAASYDISRNTCPDDFYNFMDPIGGDPTANFRIYCGTEFVTEITVTLWEPFEIDDPDFDVWADYMDPAATLAAIMDLTAPFQRDIEIPSGQHIEKLNGRNYDGPEKLRQALGIKSVNEI